MEVEYVSIKVQKGTSVTIPMTVPFYEYEILRTVHNIEGSEGTLENVFEAQEGAAPTVGEIRVYSEMNEPIEEPSYRDIYDSLLRRYSKAPGAVRATYKNPQALEKEIKESAKRAEKLKPKVKEAA